MRLIAFDRWKKTMGTFGLAAVFVAVVIMFCGTSAAYAKDTKCDGTIGGASTVTTVDGDVTVPADDSCTLNFVNVKGSVRVEHGGSLLVTAYIEPSTIGGDVDADNCVSTLLEGNVTVKGDVEISSCTGTVANGYQGPGIAIGGSFGCYNNAGPCEAWLGNIAHDVQIKNNRGTASDASLNTVDGDLECEGNTATPTRSHGYNWVSGKTKGQCKTDFSTKTTSIGVPEGSGMSCASLAALPASAFPVPNIIVTSATAAAATSTLPARCVVNISYLPTFISPVSGCHYHDNMQVQLPLPTAWNGRFFLEGQNEGSLPNATANVAAGYAAADDDEDVLTSDMLLCGDADEYQYFEDPGPLIYNSYETQQITALTAKYVIAAYYGKNASYSYDGGCSGPGREAMMWSQTFPQYFDAVYAGDPGPNLQTIEMPEMWAMEQWLNVYLTAEPPLVPTPPATVPVGSPEAVQAPEQLLYPALPLSDQQLFETALLQFCDPLDGVADGVIDNEPLCNATFDPATVTYTASGVTYPLQCPGAKAATCLSPAQVQAIKLIHRGPRTVDGKRVFAPEGEVVKDHSDAEVFGYLYDASWGTPSGEFNRQVGTATKAPGNWGSGLLQFVFSSLYPAQPTYNPLSYDFSTDQGLLNGRHGNPINATVATSLDISKFIDYGHKIIFYHAAADPGIDTLDTISYYNGMAQRYGGLKKAQEFSRMYLIPGMGHCSGGPATDTFDVLTPLTQWVEDGVAPSAIPASGVNFTAAQYGVTFVTGAPDNAPTTRNRVLCPFPQEMRFTGSTTIVGGVPVATNPSDLAVATNYTCVEPSGPDFYEAIGVKHDDHHHDHDHDGDHGHDHDNW